MMKSHLQNSLYLPTPTNIYTSSSEEVLRTFPPLSTTGPAFDGESREGGGTTATTDVATAGGGGIDGDGVSLHNGGGGGRTPEVTVLSTS